MFKTISVLPDPGMFPWMMLATLPLFCPPNWPRPLVARLPAWLGSALPESQEPQSSSHCIYTKQQIKADEKQVALGVHWVIMCGGVVFVCSHITKILMQIQYSLLF